MGDARRLVARRHEAGGRTARDWRRISAQDSREGALGGVEAGAGTLVQYAELGSLHRGRSLNGRWAATDLMTPEPRGILAVLTPWNDPVAVVAGLLGAALVSGNTVM